MRIHCLDHAVEETSLTECARVDYCIFTASLTSSLFNPTAVEGIRKKDIQEIRAMRNPPPAVKMALEAICLLLGERSTDWRQILTFIVKDSFVPSILNFDTDEIT